MTDRTRQFRTVLLAAGGNCLVVLPFDPDAAWGAREVHHVTGTVNGQPVRGPLRGDGGAHALVLGPAWQRGCGLGAGDDVAVTLAPEGPQVADLDPDLTAALAAAPAARAFFESLATFYRKNYIRWVGGARRPETRAARIGELVALLLAKKKQR